MNIQNTGILKPKPTEPNGYVTKDLMWAAVPFGKKFMILHNGEQIEVCNNLKDSKKYIENQISLTKANNKPVKKKTTKPTTKPSATKKPTKTTKANGSK